jgi:hypothetical protein
MRSPQYCEEHTELVEMERLELNLAPMNISATILLTSALLLRDLTGKCTITNTVFVYSKDSSSYEGHFSSSKRKSSVGNTLNSCKCTWSRLLQAFE